MNMQIAGGTGGTKFSEIYQQRTADGGALKGLDGEKHLRFKGGDTLYTHDSNKRHSLHFMDRASKHSAAAGAVKQAIDNELGAGAGDKIFKELGLGKKVKVGDLKDIHFKIQDAKKDLGEARLQNHVAATAGQLGEVKQRYFDLMAGMDDAGDRKASPNDDYFRQGTGGAEGRLAVFDKMQDEGVGSLGLQEAAAVIKSHFEGTPTMPVDKFVTLMTNEHVSDAVGYFTGKNTVGNREVELDSSKADPKNMKAAAEELRAAIDDTLTPKEKEALRERVDFMRDQAAANLDKLGLISTKDGEEDMQGALWAKSLAVSYGLYAGHTQDTVVKESGLQLKDASVAARDFLTAAAVHYDTIFGDR